MIGLDVGRHGTRIVTDGYRDQFRSCIGLARQLKLENKLERGDMHVVWRGREYLVGDIATRECDDASMLKTESKAHNDTLLLSLVALHRALPDSAHAHIVTGVPISNYTAGEKDLMKALYLGQHTISVNGTVKEIHIDDVRIVPESAAAYFAFGANKEEIRIIDLGSRTTGYATIIKDNFIDRLSGSFATGAENFVGSQLAYIRWIVNALSGRWNLQDPIYLIGGMAELTYPMFLEYMPNVKVGPDPVYANANAYYSMGVRRYGEKQQKVSTAD